MNLWTLQVCTIQISETLLSGHHRDLPKCPLNRGSKKVAQCLWTINIQRLPLCLLCSVVKVHVVKDASEVVVNFVQDF